MKTLSTLLERWEHPFTGNDYHPPDIDSHNCLNEDNHINSLGDALIKHHRLESDKLTNDDQTRHYNLFQDYADESHELNNHLHMNKRDLLDWHKRAYNFESFDSQHFSKLHERYLKQADHLNNALSHYSTPHDMHVYSGVGFSPKRFQRNPDKVIKVKLKAFTSTSLSPSIGMQFAKMDDRDMISNPTAVPTKNLIKIHVPAGSKGRFLADISPIPNEHEFLIANNAKLHIHPHPTIQTSPYLNKTRDTLIWHAKLVHDGFNDTRHINEKS